MSFTEQFLAETGELIRPLDPAEVEALAALLKIARPRWEFVR